MKRKNIHYILSALLIMSVLFCCNIVWRDYLSAMNEGTSQSLQQNPQTAVSLIPQPKVVSTGVENGLKYEVVENYEILVLSQSIKVTRWYIDTTVTVVVPFDFDQNMQLIDSAIIKEGMKILPPSLKEGIKEVQLLDVPNPLDGELAKKYKFEAFQTFAEISSNKNFVVFFKNGNMLREEAFRKVPFTLAHEASHIYDEKKGGYSDSKEWVEAAKKDGNDITDYSKSYRENLNSYKEDFASSVEYYYIDRKSFAKLHPNRTNLLEKILAD